METQGKYQVEGAGVYLRQSTLQSIGAGWEQPTPEEVRAVIGRAGLVPREAADFLGESRKRLSRWTTGEEDIPFTAWVLLCQRAGLGFSGQWWG